MATGRLIARAGWTAFLASWLVLVVAALYLAADAEGLGPGFARYYPYVFVAAALALLLLGGAIVQRLRGLLRRLRSGTPGARLNRRLLILLLVLALPPVLLVYAFGVRFVAATVDSWLRANSVEVLEQAVKLGRVYLDERQSRARIDVAQLAGELSTAVEGDWNNQLDAALVRYGAQQVAVFSASGRLRALAAADANWISAEPPAEGLGPPLRGDSGYVVVEPEQGQVRLRAVQRVDGPNRDAVLQAIFLLPVEYATGLQRVEQGIAAVRQAQFLREPLKLAFGLILTFVLLLSVLLAILLAFDLSRRLVAPIGRLAAATRAVSEGHFDQRLPEGLDDELGFLVRGFNRMLRELELSTARARSSQAETERQRAFLETVVGRLSSAVIVLDDEGFLRSANPAAASLLGEEPGRRVGQLFADLRRSRPELQPLVELLMTRLREASREFREEISVDAPGGRQLWLLRGARLPDGGVVAVFDDTTEIDRARRDAAWGEVARRLAHEVKNPLTPIQLAAERLRRRVLPKLVDADAEVLDRATHTIVAQVDALKTLVNAFGDYARAPTLSLQLLELPALVREVVELYAGDAQLVFELVFETGLPALRADAGRLRQVLHNLIKNSKEAAAGRARVAISIGLRSLGDGGRRQIELAVADDGPGLPAGFDAGWFEPYRTTKAKGTGLGLAIVRKIAEEHGGQLQALDNPGGGARFLLRLPL